MLRSPNLIESLRELQRRDGWLTSSGLNELAKRLNKPVHEVFGVATFYPEFDLAPPRRVKIQVCTALPCQMRDSERLIRALEARAAESADVEVRRAPCLGACDRAPAAIINHKLQSCNRMRSARHILADALEVIDGKREPRSWLPHGIEGPFKTDPYSNSAERFGAVRQLIASGDYKRVFEAIKDADLRGMGGAGKPAFRKWAQVAEQECSEKYIVCNADESEPGTLKDREILRNVPHLVVEGMIIAGLTLGASQGFIYLRHEYEEQHAAIENAIAAARTAGLLGDNAGGSGKAFDLRVFVSPGGYVLGEASALLEALEGKRGQPRNQIVDLGLKAGIPSYNGLWGQPTLVNNVETYAYVPVILLKGAQWFEEQGTAGSKGLKWVSVCGDVNNPAVFEVPLGTTFRRVIEMAGGVTGGWDNFKAFAPSGPTYGFRPPADVDGTMDFHSPPKPAVGSGAIIVLNKSRCMLDAALNFTRFLRNESCGKCAPCRLGSNQMVNLIKSARSIGDAETAARIPAEIDRLEQVLVKGSICGLGQVVAVSMKCVMKYWPEDVDQHLKVGYCSASGCPSAGRVARDPL
jgi:NADH:ubiquinone oxidoreductase subunit F (NADH-binding)/NADH:ubiquinone oxidoreductase subunit E